MTTDVTLPTTSSLVPVVELQLLGDLDIASTIALSEQIEDALSLGPHRLVVRLNECHHLDAQAIRVLLDAHRLLWDRGGRLVLAGCSAPTLRLLQIAGVLDVFELEPATGAGHGA